MSNIKLSCIINRPAKLLLLLLFCAGIQVNTATATSIQQLSINDMLDSAELIFEGHVINVESTWNNNHSAINTFVTFKIVEIIQGDYEFDKIQLSFAGGSVDDVTMEVHGMIYPELGEEGIYFVEKIGQIFVNPIVGWNQGHFLVVDDANGGQRMLTADRQPVIEMNDQQAIESALSDGVAVGLKTNKINSDLNAGMTKSKFKRQLKEKQSNRIAD